ncbi:hypothetical protein BgiMline_012644 [Biomphalaria glabrata]
MVLQWTLGCGTKKDGQQNVYLVLRYVMCMYKFQYTMRHPGLHDAVAFGAEQSHERAPGLGDLPVNVADSTEGANSKPYVNLNLPVIKQMENTTVNLRLLLSFSRTRD